MNTIFKYIEHIYVSWARARKATVAARFGKFDEAKSIMSKD